MTDQFASESLLGAYGPREWAAATRRQKRRVLAVVTAVAAIAALILFFAPRTYRSEARLFLRIGRESVRLDPTATTGDTIALQQSGRDNEIATAIEVLKSRAVAEQAVDALTPEVVLGESGAGKQKPNAIAKLVLAPVRGAIRAVKSVDPVSKREEAVTEVMENTAVDAEYNSALIVVTYDAASPKLAQEVAHALVDSYREAQVQLNQNTASKPFFAEQRAELESQLAKAEQDLRGAKNEIGLSTIEARRGTLEKRLSNIGLAHAETNQEIASTEASVAAVRTRTESMPERMHTSTMVVPNTGADSLRSQLYALQVELMSLETKYKPDHPLVAAARAQMTEAQRLVAEEESERERTVDDVNENFMALSLQLAKAESQLAGLKAKRTELEEQEAVTLAELNDLNDRQLDFDRLGRAVTLANTNYFRYAESFEQARMDEALDQERMSNVNIVQPATLVEKPVSPSKGVVALLSLVLMTVGSAAAVIMGEKRAGRTAGAAESAPKFPLPARAMPETPADFRAPLGTAMGIAKA